MNKLVNAIAWTVLIYSIAMSTTHIVETALKIGLVGVAAYTSPILVDAVFALGKLGRSRRYSEAIRKSSLHLMLFGGAMSLTCNVVAGENLGQQIHGVIVVVVMVWIESHAAKLVGHKDTTVDTGKVEPVHATATVQTVAPVNVPIAPAAPVPAITATPKQTRPATSRTTVTANVPTAAAMINPKTGQPFSARHQRRLRTGK